MSNSNLCHHVAQPALIIAATDNCTAVNSDMDAKQEIDEISNVQVAVCAWPRRRPRDTSHVLTVASAVPVVPMLIQPHSEKPL